MHYRYIIKIVSWKFIFLLATVALAIQTINFAFSWYLQKNINIDKYEILNEVSYLKISKDFSLLLRKINQRKRLDSSGKFNVVAGVIKGLTSQSYSKERGNIKPNFKDVGLSIVTHCSLNHVKLLPELVKRWQGPISIAVLLLSDEIQRGLVALLTLRYCFPEVKANVTFSLVFPLNASVVDNHIIENTDISCGFISGSFPSHIKPNYEFEGVPYPNNLLRNTARKIVDSAFITVLDIDLVPNVGLHDSFINFAIENNLVNKEFNDSNIENKTVWVLPSYEIEDNIEIPDDKLNLLSLKERGLARPFYQELCWKCQKYTNYDAWERDLYTNNNKSNFVDKLLHIYEVIWRDPWEPFYIARNNVPAYDERFYQYGFNRISQVCELHVSGYQFLVLNSAFVIHRGFKKEGSLHHSKHMEQQANRILFRQFKNDLKIKYPLSLRRCY